MPFKSQGQQRVLKQTAVYWGAPTPDGYGGSTFTAGVELAVRWEQRQEQFVGANREQLLSRAVVYSEDVLVVGGFLYLGAAADLDAEQLADPYQVDGAWDIRAVESIPSVSAAQQVRRVWL